MRINVNATWKIENAESVTIYMEQIILYEENRITALRNRSFHSDRKRALQYRYNFDRK